MPWTWNLHPREFMPQRDLKKYPIWFTDFSHSYPSWTPLFNWMWCYALYHGEVYAINETWLPTIRSSELRTLDGCSLDSSIRIPDEAEIKQREANFRKFIMEDYAPNWDGILSDLRSEIAGLSIKFRKYNYDEATQYELYKIFREAIQYLYRMWETHFYLIYPMFNAYWCCAEIVEEYTGMKELSPPWHRLIRGYDNELFAQDRALWELRTRALELKTADVFQSNAASDVIPALKKTVPGREWVETALHEFLFDKGYGWRAPRMMEFINPVWWEDPTPVVAHIQQYLSLSTDANEPFPLDKIRPRLVEERETLTRELIEKVKAAHYPDMDWFLALLSVSQRTSSFSEGHDVVWEQGTFSTFRYCVRKIGERLVRAGTMESPDDMFFFIPDELELFIACPEAYDLREIVAERRKNWIAQKEYKSRPAIISARKMTPEEINAHHVAVHDPMITKISTGEYAPPRPETGAICFGNCGSPSGVTEGRARMVVHEPDVYQVQPGDIMVCPAMSSGWTPVLPLIKGIVTNGGGALGHACVVGREYDIPVVSQTNNATMVIKDGERIRVDADQGLVFRV